MHAFAATSCAPDHIDIFYLEPEFSIAHKTWDGTQWGVGWEKLGGEFSTVPAAVATRARPLPPGGGTTHGGLTNVGAVGARTAAARTAEIFNLKCRTDVFAVGTDFAMYHMTLWDGVPASGAQWSNLGGIFTSAPAVIAWQGGRIDLFCLGTDRAMYRKIWNGAAWSFSWERLGGTFSSQASVVDLKPDRIDVFVRGDDHTLRHRAFSPAGPLNDWQNLGGSLASMPVAVSWGENRLDVFAAGHDGALWHRWWDGEFWNDWESLGGNFSSAPTATSSAERRLDVLITSPDGSVSYYFFSDESWHGPELLKGNIASAPTAISVAPHRLHVVAPGNDMELYHKAFDGTAWSPVLWDLLGDHVTLPTRYSVSVDYVKVDTARSLNNDTDTSQATIAPGNWALQSKTQSIGDIGGTDFKTTQTNLLVFTPIVEMCDTLRFNYIVINNGHADQVTLDNILVNTGSSLAGAGVTALTGVSLMGTAAGFVLSKLGAFLFQDCDGVVAVEQVDFSGRDLRLKTGNHELDSVVTVHPGTDSPTGCGSNSRYEVTWSIKRTG